MADLLKVVVTGASGRMGQTLVNLITRHNEIELVGALEHPKHQWIGQDIGVAMGGSALGVVVSEDPTVHATSCADQLCEVCIWKHPRQVGEVETGENLQRCRIATA